MKGRKPKLTAIEGGAMTGRCASAPSWLPQHAKSEWKRAAPELHGRNLLTEDVLATLESYCVSVGLIRETEEIMGREGRLIEGPNGAAPHPAFRMQNTAMREARLLAAELGLTPHRRGTGVIEGKPNNDKWEGDLLA